MNQVEQLASWIEVSPECDFTIHNVPFGVYQSANGEPHCCTAIGDYLVDLKVLAENGYFSDLPADIFRMPSLNAFIALGKDHTRAIRQRLIDLFAQDNQDLQSDTAVRDEALKLRKDATMMMPVDVGDYTDFYSSKEHASNVGSMLRDPKNPLLPNWKHLPVAYHGRASSIVVSGTPVTRPMGQFKRKPDQEVPVFAATEKLDYELELAFVVGRSSALGQRIAIEQAEEYIFGFLLFNDWSARDIQSWEYVPLGPFLSKNFQSSVSPWVVTTEALAPFRVRGPEPEVPLLPYLQCDGEYNFDIALEVLLQPEGGKAQTIGQTNFRYMYWNVCQQLAHHTVNGCNVKTGDLIASGTISGTGPKASGCLLELTRNGQEPLQLADGTRRTFLADGDTVIMRGAAEKNGIRVGFGEVVGKVIPAT